MIPAGDLVERVLRAARADETMCIVTDRAETNVRWAGGSPTTNGLTTARHWTVISLLRSTGGTRIGVVGSASTDPDAVAAVVRAAEDAARAAEPVDDTAPLVAGAEDPDWGDDAATTDFDVLAGVVDALATGFGGPDPLYGYAEHAAETVTLGTSTGVRRRHVQPTGSIEINAKRGDASVWVGAGTTDFTDVDTEALLADAARRLDWSARTVSLPAGRYETLLPPSTVADLLIPLMWAMEGRAAHEGRSAFAAPEGRTRVGERLTSLPLALVSDPTAPGIGYRPFVATESSGDALSLFDNGMTADAVEWIADGTIAALAYSRASAHRFDAPVAVPGDNLILHSHSTTDLDAMIASTEHGLLLTTLWYIRDVDPTTLLLTGLTRDGVYLVEDGEVRAAVNNFRFNESPLDLLRRATEAGATERTLPREWKDWFTRTAMPALRIPDFHMSSVSRAQ
ncbi:TldD/PmbA family protein [Rhodococcus rhodnii]|uniref:Metalloprotease TldD/E C-terminal domain-containing protein n=2 Tax=Rhodococcus rhodnii TaxID=38312 RepID=R7WSV7_9NOCA|nr:metallopeptidase TldD-related protein [Rhodococcus rhodnii]EOM78350.1 hypothetical protein Rrhod_0178 [Rhodococcus rhodnii LMG 5362]TXG91186.1 TldD/PmbA family protein [Rhodococcus rhodnii]